MIIFPFNSLEGFRSAQFQHVFHHIFYFNSSNITFSSLYLFKPSYNLSGNPFQPLSFGGYMQIGWLWPQSVQLFQKSSYRHGKVTWGRAAAVARWWWQLTFRRQCGIARGRFTRVLDRPLPTCGHIMFWRVYFWRESTRSKECVFFLKFIKNQLLLY